MKLISLNIWGGKLGQALFDYLEEEARTADIFCFQEIFKIAGGVKPQGAIGRMSLYGELIKLLPEHRGFFALASRNHDLEKPVNFEAEAGTAMFVRRDFKILKQESTEISGKIGDSADPGKFNPPTVLQRVDVEVAGKVLSIFNYHGIAYPGDKLDNPERLNQSRKISDVLSRVKQPKILCGDFNLMPETQSTKILDKKMRNLIKEYKIASTRNKHSWQNYNNIQHFADYAFVSPEIEVKNFEVPCNEVSDHLPLVLDFLITNPV